MVLLRRTFREVRRVSLVGKLHLIFMLPIVMLIELYQTKENGTVSIDGFKRLVPIMH